MLLICLINVDSATENSAVFSQEVHLCFSNPHVFVVHLLLAENMQAVIKLDCCIGIGKMTKSEMIENDIK
jgi:hypothetical protein